MIGLLINSAIHGRKELRELRLRQVHLLAGLLNGHLAAMRCQQGLQDLPAVFLGRRRIGWGLQLGQPPPVISDVPGEPIAVLILAGDNLFNTAFVGCYLCPKVKELPEKIQKRTSRDQNNRIWQFFGHASLAS